MITRKDDRIFKAKTSNAEYHIRVQKNNFVILMEVSNIFFPRKKMFASIKMNNFVILSR